MRIKCQYCKRTYGLDAKSQCEGCGAPLEAPMEAPIGYMPYRILECRTVAAASGSIYGGYKY